MKATLEVQKAIFLDKVGTLIVQSLHAWQHQQLVSIKIKFKLSSSQEPSQCLFLNNYIYIYKGIIKVHKFAYDVAFRKSSDMTSINFL